MAIDHRHIGHAFPSFQVQVTEERLRRFAEAIGEAVDPAISVLAPPTFLKCIEGEHDSSRAILEALNVDLKRVLHAEQEFEYFTPIRAGDRLTVDRRVSDIYDKRGGVMEFIVIETLFRDDSACIAARSRQLVLVRNPTAEARQ